MSDNNIVLSPFRYLGYVKEGYANGLGILALSTGEKYKGYFDRWDILDLLTTTICALAGRRACQHSVLARLCLVGVYTYNGYMFVLVPRDVRHGSGACAYPNGSRYAGQWYR